MSDALPTAGAPTSTPAAKESVLTPPAAVEGKETPAKVELSPEIKQGEVAKAEPAPEKPAEQTDKVVKTDDPPPKESTKAPEKYELKTRNNSPLLKDDLAEIEANAKAKGLSQEDAQKMVEGREADHDKFFDRQLKLFEAQKDEWKKATESDPELCGKDGKAFKENVEMAHRGMKRFFGDSFNKHLLDTGFGNHPDVVKGFARIGRELANDKAVLDGKSTTPGKGKSREEKLYGSHFKKE